MKVLMKYVERISNYVYDILFFLIIYVKYIGIYRLLVVSNWCWSFLGDRILISFFRKKQKQKIRHQSY